MNWRISNLLLPHNLCSGAKHVPLISQRPFHFHCSIGTLLLCRDKHNFLSRVYCGSCTATAMYMAALDAVHKPQYTRDKRVPRVLRRRRSRHWCAVFWVFLYGPPLCQGDSISNWYLCFIRLLSSSLVIFPHCRRAAHHKIPVQLTHPNRPTTIVLYGNMATTYKWIRTRT